MVAKPQTSFEPQKKQNEQKNQLKGFCVSCSFCGLEKIETSLKTYYCDLCTYVVKISTTFVV